MTHLCLQFVTIALFCLRAVVRDAGSVENLVRDETYLYDVRDSHM